MSEKNRPEQMKKVQVEALELFKKKNKIEIHFLEL